jgi:predicted transcriptional regulator
MLDTDHDTLSPLSSKRNTVQLLRQLKEAGESIVLTVNGTAELVVQDATSYEKLLELVDRLETIEAIREGIASVDRGEGRPAEEVFEEIRRRNKIHQKP